MQEADEALVRFYAQMPTSALLHFALSGRTAGTDVWMIASTAVDRINDYIMAARVQMERIWADRQASQDLLQSSVSQGGADEVPSTNWIAHKEGFQLQKMAFVDIHFYFSCWDNIRKMLRVLCKRVDVLKTPEEVFKKHKKILDDFSGARHNLEHFDERLPGENNAAQAVSPPDSMVSGAGYLGYGNLDGGMYRFGPRSWDVTPSSLMLLEEIVNDLDHGLREEATSMLIEKHRKRFSVQEMTSGEHVDDSEER